uniref:(northern house mosquito) hypothetical protein n=1 Tax=Culex pipiens TaxID=7175 RepID=A0A8D8HS22_CULPI
MIFNAFFLTIDYTVCLFVLFEMLLVFFSPVFFINCCSCELSFVWICEKVCSCVRVRFSSSLKRIVLFLHYLRTTPQTKKAQTFLNNNQKKTRNYEEPFRTVLRFALCLVIDSCFFSFFSVRKAAASSFFFCWEAPSFKTGDASRIE